MADLTRRRRVLYDKPILDSLADQIWNGMQRIVALIFSTSGKPGSDWFGHPPSTARYLACM